MPPPARPGAEEESSVSGSRTPCVEHGTSSPSSNEAQISFSQLREVLERRNIAVTAGTIDLGILMSHDLDGTLVDPRKIVSLLDTEEIFYHVWVATKRVVDGLPDGRAIRNIDKLTRKVVTGFLVELGVALFDFVPGPHITFVDPRNFINPTAMIEDARRLHAGFMERGINNEKIVISIPGTEQGAAAAKALQSEHGIHVNLTHITSLVHAIACSEAEPTIMTIPVGRVLEWHEARRGKVYQDMNNHPGIETIRTIAAYLKLHGIETKLLGTNFRRPQEILCLDSLDAISLTKLQIERLDTQHIAPRDSTSKPSFPTPDDANRALFRARQAQYPTAYLSGKTGFMSSTSAETQSALSNVSKVSGHPDTVWLDSEEEKMEVKPKHPKA